MTLVGWWKLLDGTGTIAIDSVNGNNGNLVDSPAWITTGPNGGGLSFRGGITHDSVQITRAAVLEPAALTISCWIKGPYDSAQSNQATFGKAINNDLSPFTSYQISVAANDDDTAAGFSIGAGGSGHVIVIFNVVLNNTAWQNFVGTYDPAASQPRQLFYLNGVLIGSMNTSGAINYDPTPAGDLYIAANSDLSVQVKTYRGSITDCRIYDRALTATEILRIYQGEAQDISIVRGPHRGSRVTPPYNP